MLQIDSQMRIKKNALNKDIRSSACCLIRALSTAACGSVILLHFSIASNLDAVLEFLSVGLFWYSFLWSKFPEQAKEERDTCIPCVANETFSALQLRKG